MGFSVSFFSFSSWGKFGERQNKPQTHVILSAHQRRGGTKLEDQFIYCHFHNSSCQIEIVLRVRNITTASVVL